MPLIIEDGTGVEDADSYIDVDDARSLAAKRGIVLSSSDDELAQQLAASADRLNGYEQAFSGYRATSRQALSYPRTHSYRYGSPIDDVTIPRELKLAQVVMAGMLNEGGSLWYDVDSQGIKSEKIDVLSVEYSESKSETSGNPALPQVESILTPLVESPNSYNFVVSR